MKRSVTRNGRERGREREKKRNGTFHKRLAMLFIVNQLAISERREKTNRQDRSDTKELRFMTRHMLALAGIQSFRSLYRVVASSDRDRISSLKDKRADNSRSLGKKWSNAGEPAVTQDPEKRIVSRCTFERIVRSR